MYTLVHDPPSENIWLLFRCNNLTNDTAHYLVYEGIIPEDQVSIDKEKLTNRLAQLLFSCVELARCTFFYRQNLISCRM